MLSVVLVDDEKWMIEYITNNLDWQKDGLELIGSAENGYDALKLIEAKRPDIVLTDIQMPVMDGITLFSKVKEIGYTTAFIFFSGYNLFEYAKLALNMGAIGYVLKPIDIGELELLLDKAIKYIETEKWKLESNQIRSTLAKQQRYTEQQNFILSILDHIDHLTMDIYAEMKNLDIVFSGNVFRYIVIEFDDTNELDRSGFTNISVLYMKNILTQGLNHAFTGSDINYFILDAPKGKDVFMNYNLGEDVVQRESLYNICAAIKNAFHHATGSTISIGLGNEVPSLPDIRDSITSAKCAIDHRLIAGKNSIIDYSAIQIKETRIPILDKELKEMIAICMEKQDLSMVPMITEHIHRLMNQTCIDVEDIKYFNYHFTEYIFGLLSRKSISPEALGNPHTLCDEMDYCKGVNEVVKKTEKMLYSSLDDILRASSNYYNKLIVNMKKYVEEHFNEEINLDSLAHLFSFHPNYLGKLFKEETGENFVDYLTQYRMDIAKELLKDIRLNVYQVAKKVGYDDAKYFSKVFKKVVGLTPKDYIGFCNKLDYS